MFEELYTVFNKALHHQIAIFQVIMLQHENIHTKQAAYNKLHGNVQ